MFHAFFEYHLYVYQTILLFAAFSFMGWLLETVYRSITNRRFINAGYLFGPFTPIYGAGGLAIMLAGILLRGKGIAVQMIYFALLTTALEFVIGVTIQKIFGHRLWDYHDNRFNFRGIICLKYSVIWAVLAWVFFYVIFPVTYIAIDAVDPFIVKIAAIVFVLYFIIDAFVSTLAMADFFHRVEALYEGFASVSGKEFENIGEKFRRFLSAFPDLGRIMENVINGGFSVTFNKLLGKLARKRHIRRTNMEHEYLGIVKEIMDHDQHQRLKEFYHHNSSIHEHVQSVAYMSYKIAKALKLDYVSTARGALLHDFFLYDWRNHDYPDLAADKYHGFAHPRIALENARKHFAINPIEEDIIVKHMWPITIIPPRYKESFVVTFADKYMSSKEYTHRFRETIKRAGGKVGSGKKKMNKTAKKR
jgi:uncharacterized membrane protein/HD superfamily phosphodiesterase